MLCQNCGKSEVTFRYTQVINGVKKEMHLCDKCASELGVKDINFSMPISFSNFLSDFFNEYNDNLLPNFIGAQEKECSKCKTTFEDFMDNGEFGCSNCYDTFENKISQILKNLQGANRHIGREYRKITSGEREDLDKEKTVSKKEEISSELEKLQKDLQKAIKDERYEDAAKLRDTIKEIESKKNNKKQE